MAVLMPVRGGWPPLPPDPVKVAELSKPSRYSLDRQVGFLLRKASQRHAAIFFSNMPDELTATQWAALTKIAEIGDCSQIQLGRETAMDAATIKGVIDRLLRRRLVTSTVDPGDARRRIISLTDEGRDIVERNIQAAISITEATLNGLSEGERGMLVELLQKIS